MNKNKIRLLFLYGIILLCKDATAQSFDKCVLKCTYKFFTKIDSTNKLSDLNATNDLMVLEVGQKSSLFYSELRRIGDSIIAEDEKAGYNSSFINVSNTQKYNLNQWDIIIAKNFPIEEVTVEEKLVDVYRCSEKLISQSWEITDDTLKIAGLMCIKAITNYRGRTYEAWFTKQVSTPHGPWKFYGLPGLIVKVSDMNKLFNLELTALVKMPDNIPMVFPSRKYSKISRKDLLDFKASFYKDPISFMENNLPYHLKFKDIPAEERKEPTMPYNPIEKY